MAIVRVESGGSLSRQVGIKAAAKKAAKKGVKKGAKKGAKHAIEKHAAKKHAAKKHADKHAGKKAAKHVHEEVAAGLKADAKTGPDSGKLVRAFHHLQRASVVISLVEKGSGGDLKALLDLGAQAYARAAEKGASGKKERQAVALLKGVEHLAMAGLYSARIDFRVSVPTPAANKMAKRLVELRARLEKLGTPAKEPSQNLLGLAWELLRRADAAGDDAQLEWELGMASEGLCEALEEGF